MISINGRTAPRDLHASASERLPRKIDGTSFGDITIDGQIHDHYVIIRRDGDIKKRKKKLSKQQY